MTRVPPPFLLALAACAFAKGSAQPAPPASIVRIELPSESEERQPISVPTEPGNTVEVDLPWPLRDWAGRGFTPDAEKFAGDFVIEAARGETRFFVTPVAADAHRVLHVILDPRGGVTRSVVFGIPAGTRRPCLAQGGARGLQPCAPKRDRPCRSPSGRPAPAFSSPVPSPRSAS